MIDTNQIRAKIDGLSAADGADTYWRCRMIEALDEVDKLRAVTSEYTETLIERDIELDEIWDTLGLADYDGEDSASHFIERLQQIVEKHKDCQANAIAAVNAEDGGGLIVHAICERIISRIREDRAGG